MARHKDIVVSLPGYDRHPATREHKAAGRAYHKSLTLVDAVVDRETLRPDLYNNWMEPRDQTHVPNTAAWETLDKGGRQARLIISDSILLQIEAALRHPINTPWENHFLHSVRGQIKKSQGQMGLSEKQWQVVYRVLDLNDAYDRWHAAQPRRKRRA